MLLISTFVAVLIYAHCATAPREPGPSGGFTITLRHTALCRAPLDERSDSRRDLHLTTHSTHKGQTSMSPAAFKPAILANDWPQTPALDRAAASIDIYGFITKFCA